MKRLLNAFKTSLILFTIFGSGVSFAQNNSAPNPENLKLEAQAAGVAYWSFVPQFEENQDPKRSPIIEVYTGYNDGSEEAFRQMRWVKSHLSDDFKNDSQTDFEMNLYGFKDSDQNDAGAQKFMEEMGASKTAHFQLLPATMKRFHSESTQNEVKPSRKPAKIEMRGGWTVIRFVLALGAKMIGAHYEVAADQFLLSVLISVPAAIMSAATNYYSSQYSEYLSSGRSSQFIIKQAKKWGTWLLHSKNQFAKSVKARLGITDSFLDNLSDAKKALIKKGLEFAEIVIKWEVTEVVFFLCIKVPAVLAGLSTLSMSALIVGSLAGLATQFPGDKAAIDQKYQKLEALKEGVLNGTIQVEEKDRLLSEITPVIERDKSKKLYIDDNSHPALKKIENQFRMYSTINSASEIIGASLLMAGQKELGYIELAALGVGGTIYLMSVHDYFKQGGKVHQAGKFVIEQAKMLANRVTAFTSRICKGRMRGDTFDDPFDDGALPW